ncbi:hypothetical protein T265_00885 [Opisthorchis viverrini]|uniref:Uncharacterized protein n=1 Tax=Opisthorchis viverrini TaxID=6198 RepID=A0A075A4K7_OPIVI|nr:hypothetical protein T265_00885 [Opisthorchis viverrini]KER33187.1 hypothetical protein T265_00885 [Opisthorchis viverrini]
MDSPSQVPEAMNDCSHLNIPSPEMARTFQLVHSKHEGTESDCRGNRPEWIDDRLTKGQWISCE